MKTIVLAMVLFGSSALAQTACKSEEDCKSFIYRPGFCREGRAKYKRETKQIWKAYCKNEGVKRG